MVQISKMKHGALMRMKFEKTNRRQDDQDAPRRHVIIAETRNLGFEYLTLVQFKDHL